MKIVSWLPLLTDHQYFTWLEMHKRGHEIIFILGKNRNEDREKQGWKSSNYDEIPSRELSPTRWWSQARKWIDQNSDAVQVFGGFWADKRFFSLILHSVYRGAKTVVMNESYSEIAIGYLKEENAFLAIIKKRLRPLLYKAAILLTKLVNPRNPLCFLAISPLAETQIKKAGLKETQIFPWGYFVPKAEMLSVHPKLPNNPLRIIFIGALIKRKGIDLAVEAVNRINLKNNNLYIKLDLYGPGDPSRYQKDTIGIEYKGTIPFGQAQKYITDYHFLLLPSLHDGWGVVINEALLQGVPVIVSNRVGAQTLIINSKAGVIFDSDLRFDLQEKLEELLEGSNQYQKYAQRAVDISQSIQPEFAAEYLEKVFEYYFNRKGSPPIPNWYSQEFD